MLDQIRHIDYDKHKRNIYFTCVYHSVLFSLPKDVRLNSTHYLIMKINNRKELQNIAVNHSADFDYKDFVKIYRECTKNLILYVTTN